ncbi:MAG TPA: MlaD family protein [Candidatus Dormibacteraeota bacterium]|nr:MlaD family protein [Candidatus Dormibacteraeota bacterium]
MTGALRRIAGFVLSSRGALLGVLAAAAVAGVAFGIGGSPAHTVVARFRDVDGLVVGANVRIAGVDSGSVQSIGVRHDAQHEPCQAAKPADGTCDPHAQPGDSDAYAEVTVSVDDAHWPLHDGTTVSVRPKGVLSDLEVVVTPGSASAAALPNGHVFDFDMAAPQTTWPVNLDQVTDVFGQYVKDPRIQVTTQLRTQIQQGGTALANGGAQSLNGTLANLNPLTRDTTPLAQVLAEHTPALDDLNGELATITGDLAREDPALRGVIANGDILFTAIADKQQSLQGVLDHAASTFATLNGVVAGEEQNLVTVLDKGPAALQKIQQSSSLVTPLLLAVDPHISSLDILLHEFTTATGYVAAPFNIDTLRVDGSLPPLSRSAYPCGGQPLEQPACATKVSPSAVTGTSSAAPASGGAATQAADSTPMLGGLFG